MTDLEILAVAPTAQRRGFGRALLEAVLAEADRENLPVYLEASAGELSSPLRAPFAPGCSLIREKGGRRLQSVRGCTGNTGSSSAQKGPVADQAGSSRSVAGGKASWSVPRKELTRAARSRI